MIALNFSPQPDNLFRLFYVIKKCDKIFKIPVIFSFEWVDTNLWITRQNNQTKLISMKKIILNETFEKIIFQS